MTAHQSDLSRKMVFGGKMHDQWDRPRWGLYQLTFAGHDLEVTKSRPQPGLPQKLYTVKIDGVPVAKAWQASDGRSRAISLVKRMLKGKPLVPLVETDTVETHPSALEKGLHQEWTRLEMGVYKLTYRAHDLEIRKGPRDYSDFNSNPEKRYTISIDGVAVAKAWSPAQARPQAIRLANQIDDGKPLVPFAEVDTAEPTFEAVDQHAALPGYTTMKALFKKLEQVPRMVDLNADLLRPRQSEKEDFGSVSFTITGRLDLDPTNALTALTTAVDLLRENGHVKCDVVLPSRITL
jgi:hypothetical protein